MQDLKIVVSILNNCTISCVDYQKDNQTDVFISCKSSVCEKMIDYESQILDYIRIKIKNVNLIVIHATDSQYKVVYQICKNSEKLITFIDRLIFVVAGVALFFKVIQDLFLDTAKLCYLSLCKIYVITKTVITYGK